MKTFDFSYNGGYPFDQPTLDRMQSAYFEILKSFVGFMKIPAVGNHILFGCEIAGNNITPGMMYIDGDLCSFVQVPGTLATKIKKKVTVTNLPFLNGTNNPVWKTTTAIVDGTGVALSEFTRYSDALIFDANYVHTDNNFTAALLAKLNGIAPGAQVNVQPNWNDVNPLSMSFIANKPNVISALRKGTTILGDFPGGTDEIRTISFPNVGTSNYMVLGSLVMVNSGAWNSNNDVIFTIGAKTASSFQLAGREVAGASQSLIFDYILIAF